MSDMTLVLGNKNYSSWSLRGWLAMKASGADFEEIVIPLYRGEYKDEIRRYSPSGRVPALHHGELVIWDSLAIGEYLVELFPDAGLWPADRTARAVARAVSAEMHAGFAALRAHLPMNIRGHFPDRGVTPEVQQEINRITALWRDCRTRFGGDGAFLFGDFTLADVMYAPVVTRFHSFAVTLDEASSAYCAAVRAWPAMEEWAAAAADEPWIVDYAEF